MEHWIRQPYFLDRDTSFIGPLESAATLGIMKTFRIYKPAPECAGFLEIQHFGTGFLSLVGHALPLQLSAPHAVLPARPGDLEIAGPGAADSLTNTVVVYQAICLPPSHRPAPCP